VDDVAERITDPTAARRLAQPPTAAARCSWCEEHEHEHEREDDAPCYSFDMTGTNTPRG
jgi:hypothetical protein